MHFKSFAILLLVEFVASESDYCDPKLCPNGLKHVGCGSSDSFSSSCPKDRRFVNLTDTETRLILNLHNQIRNRVANGSEVGFLPASRMATMTWSSELAKLAAINVKKCRMFHDSCRSTAEFKYAGQNLALRSVGGAFEPLDVLIEKIIKSWYEEVANTAQSDIDKCCASASGKTVGHFTQIVTDRATHVGCAISSYTEKQWKTSLITCNYAFTNIHGMRVYLSGATGTGCKSGRNPDFPALCDINESFKVSL